VITAIAVALLAVLAVGISNQGGNNSIAYSVASHHYKPAPDADAALPVLEGSAARTRTLADYRGKVVLVNLFASWCVQCQLEAPVLDRAETLLRAHGGTVLGITYSDTPSDALTFVRDYHVNYPVLEDVSGNLANAYNVSGVPDSYLINRQGKIVALNLYQLTDGWLKQNLTRWLAS
jgi:cytochrome c biogenesis protein CcmG/thiol:disulfide interchange protein DsbE